MNPNHFYYNTDNPAYLGSINKLSNTIKNSSIRNKIKKQQIKNWLSTQDTYTLHRSTHTNFPRNHYFVYTIDELWEADLIDLSKYKQHNDNYKYILTVIDVFSKFAFGFPLKSKGSVEVTKAFKNIIDNSQKFCGFKRYPIKLQTDKGKEFKNKVLKEFLKSRKISLQFPLTQSKHKAAIAERFNRTIQTLIYKYFTSKNTLRYIDILPKLLYLYNHTIHRTIKMRPIDVNEKNILQVYNNTHQSKIKKNQKHEQYDNIYTQPFQLGDLVRVIRRKPVFEPGYTQRWTTEKFHIKKIIRKHPYFLYKIEDLKFHPIREKFYKHELQKILE